MDRDSHETIKVRPFLGSHASARQEPHREAFPGGRQVRGKTRLVDLGVGQTAQGARVEIGSPRGQRTDELHAGEAAQLIAQAIGGADDRVVDHLQGDTPGAHRRLPAKPSEPAGIWIMPSRLRGVTVRWPAKAAWAAFCASRSSRARARARVCVCSCCADADPACPESADLEDRDLCLLHEAQEPCTIAAGQTRFLMRCSTPKERIQASIWR